MVPAFVCPAILTVVAWFLALVTWVCRRTLAKFNEQAWDKYLFKLIVIQTGVLFWLYHWRDGIQLPTSISMGIHVCLIPGTVLVFDARNDDEAFTLRSGIFLLALIGVILADLIICAINIYLFLNPEVGA